jgi:uncharacterized protein
MSTNALHRLQRALTQHIRDPEAHAVPAGIEARRMRIYDDLIYNNIEGFISKGFPVLRLLHDDRAWHALVRAFVARHRCRTPLFLEIGEEFLAFIRDDAEAKAQLPPFAEELAHYEWVELALDVDEQDIEYEGVDRDGDLLSAVPVLSPLAVPLLYRYPVHRITAAFRPTEPASSPCCLIVYRDRGDRVGFLEVNPLTLRLVELIGEGHENGTALADRIGAEIGRTDSEAMRQGVLNVLILLRERDVVLGTRRGAAVP